MDVREQANRNRTAGYAVSTGRKKVEKLSTIFGRGVNEVSRKWKSVDTRLTREGEFGGIKKPN